MRTIGIAPNEFSYTAAASACSKTGDWKVALALLQEMKDREGLAPNEFTYTAVVSFGCEGVCILAGSAGRGWGMG